MGLYLLVECQGKDPCPPKKKLEPREDKWCSNVTPVFLAIFTKVVYPCKSRCVTNLHNHWTYWKLGNKGKFLCFPFIQLVERNLPPTPSDQISPEVSTGSRVLQPYTWVILGDHMLISIFTVLMNLKFMTCLSYTTSKFFYDTFNQMIQNVLNNHGLATPQRKSKEQNQTLPLKGLEDFWYSHFPRRRTRLRMSSQPLFYPPVQSPESLSHWVRSGSGSDGWKYDMLKLYDEAFSIYDICFKKFYMTQG